MWRVDSDCVVVVAVAAVVGVAVVKDLTRARACGGDEEEKQEECENLSHERVLHF